ncbi:MAG: heme biosynthesis protein HemY, partial [Pseudonocardiaceae bacterium]
LDLPAKVRAYRLRRARNRARSTMHDALMAYFEGRYNAAEKSAAKALALDEWPALSSVVAARSAHQLRRFGEPDNYLRLADEAGPEARLLRPITQAELLLRESRASEALDALREVGSVAPKSVAALRLTLKAQTIAKNWDEVLALTDRLQKLNGIDPAYAGEVRRTAWLGLLNRKAQDPQGLTAVWEMIPAEYRRTRDIALAAAKYFIAQGGVKQAIGIIESGLEAQWDPALIDLYGDCLSQNVVRQIERAEGWLQEHRKDPMLLLTLGKLCAKQALWGKAQSYLEASLAVEPTQAAHIALAQLLESLGKHNEALRHYRESLTLDRRRWAIGEEPKLYRSALERTPVEKVDAAE